MVNDQRQAVDRSGVKALWLGLGSLLLALFCVPLPLGVVVGIIAVVVGLRARKPGVKVPGAVAGIVFGVIGTVISAIMCTGAVYLWSEINGYQKCTSTANTNTDEDACKDIWLPKLEKKLHVPEGTFTDHKDLF
ncbi:hypothetical protein [Actinocorallia longicatena]|uniref:DUF4190 domain-containing protein n=1 Tax=Actinocorallia longicatena TaxID=111803 RepID=A0ABP6QJZ8_9ACTN